MFSVKGQSHKGLFVNVCLWYIKCFPLIIINKFYHITIIFHTPIGLSKDTIPKCIKCFSVDKRSRSHSLSCKCLFVVYQMLSAHYHKNLISQSFHISNDDWSWRDISVVLGEDMPPIDFVLTRSKVKVL